MYLRYKYRTFPRFLFRQRGFNVFHCCIQKSATQWFRKFTRALSDCPGVKLTPIGAKNYIPRPWKVREVLEALPDGTIVSPLYIRYPDFMEIFGQRNFKAFFVMRDPRDIVVSDYFSLKETHPIKNEYFAEWRHRLNQVELREGLRLRIRNMDWNFFTVLDEWADADHPAIRLVQYEDFFSDRQTEVATDLVRFLGLSVRDEELKGILDRLCFRKKSGGRTAGEEDVSSHYRKGVAGDWMNYFDEDLKREFKSQTGRLLMKLDYEADENW